MKYFVLAALLGLISLDSQQVSAIQNYQGVRNYNQEYESESESESESSEDDHLVMLRDNELYYEAGDQGMTPNGVEYIRTIPDQFGEESTEKFMKHILNDYALEKKNEKGGPSGVFVMEKKQTMAVARETLEKHKGLKGKELDAYMKQYFQRTWDHFDVNNNGSLDALDMTAFMKYLASDQGIDLDQ